MGLWDRLSSQTTGPTIEPEPEAKQTVEQKYAQRMPEFFAQYGCGVLLVIRRINSEVRDVITDPEHSQQLREFAQITGEEGLDLVSVYDPSKRRPVDSAPFVVEIV